MSLIKISQYIPASINNTGNSMSIGLSAVKYNVIQFEHANTIFLNKIEASDVISQTDSEGSVFIPSPKLKHSPFGYQKTGKDTMKSDSSTINSVIFIPSPKKQGKKRYQKSYTMISLSSIRKKLSGILSLKTESTKSSSTKLKSHPRRNSPSLL